MIVEGDVVQSGGVIHLNGGSLNIGGNYRIQSESTDAGGNQTYTYSAGQLWMTNTADYILVNGDFVTDSKTDHSALLTAGVFELKGDFTQQSTYEYHSAYEEQNFSTSGTHKVILSGDTKQVISFEDALLNYSHFNKLEITNSSAEGVEFITKVVVKTLFDHQRNIFTLFDSSETSFVDYDSDGIKDHLDEYPTDPNEWADFDMDGIGNNADPDDDNDGITDAWELQYGLDPLDASDASLDNDNDGISNLDEFLQGTNPIIVNATNIQNTMIKRSEFAKSVLQAKYGNDYIPPDVLGTVYDDVNTDTFNAKWIEKLAADKFTDGCAVDRFCPEMLVTKEQLAKVLLKAKFGFEYQDPMPAGLFNDVPTNHLSAGYIEGMINQSYTEGCTANKFCPNEAVTVESFETILNRVFP